MAFHSLTEFIKQLEKEGELIRIQETVSPILEISEITDRVSKSPDGGKALLFENVEGSRMPVLINAFGSTRRMNLALGVHDIEAVPKEIERYLKIAPPATLMDKVKLLPLLLNAAHFPPKIVGSGKALCQEVVHLGEDVDLGAIPILQCWPNDAGRFITFPIVINRSVDGAIRETWACTGCRCSTKTPPPCTGTSTRTGRIFFTNSNASRKVKEWRWRWRSAPIRPPAIRGVGPPALRHRRVSAGGVHPQGGGAARQMQNGGPGSPRHMRRSCWRVTIDPNGYEAWRAPSAITRVTTRRTGTIPVFAGQGHHAPQGSGVSHHHCRQTAAGGLLSGQSHRAYLSAASCARSLPEIVDMNMPLEGVFHNSVIVSIDKRYPMQARRMMSALWGLGQMSFVKTILVLDADVDVHDTSAVLNVLLNHVDFHHDLFFSEGILDVLNHASDRALYGSKLGIDATTKIEGEPGFGDDSSTCRTTATLPIPQTVLNQFKEVTACRNLDRLVADPVMFVALDKTRAHQGKEFITEFFKDAGFTAISILIVLEAHVDLENYSAIMWKFFNNLDPRRDFHFVGEHLGIDVTRKLPEEGYGQDWPDEIVMSQEIKDRVDQKWGRLFGKE